MTTRQLSVSAIRQQFESINYLETPDRQSTAPKHAVASKPESDAVTQKKQPPKTRPKPKMSVVVAAESGGDGVNYSGGDVVLARRQRCTAIEGCMARQRTGVSLPTSASDPSLAKPLCKYTDSEMHIVRSSVKESMPSRWLSACSLLSDVGPSYTDDVKEAIKRAKQKIVLQRVVGMKLEGESLPYVADKSQVDIVDVNTHGKMNGLQSTRLDLLADITRSPPTADDTKSFSVSTDASLHADASTITNHESTSAGIPEPSSLLDTEVVIERSNSSPTVKTLDLQAGKTTTENEESGSGEAESATCQDIKTHVGVMQTKRPTSLYPQQSSLETHSPITVTDASLSTDDNWTPAACPPSLPSPLRNAPSTGYTQDVTPAKRPQVATLRKSYLALREFVGENFSFLDELDDTQCSSGDSDSCGADDVEQTAAAVLQPTSTTSIAVSSTDQTSSAATAQHYNQDRPDDEKEQITQMSCTNERPKSLLRRSIVLPNGDILEIIGNAFTFLDDYGDQTGDNWIDHSCIERKAQDMANGPQLKSADF